MAKNNNSKEEPIEKQLWKTADKLRKNIDAAEYAGAESEDNLHYS